jgi:glycosyltransferase involved in cell wall biosynthesis
LDCEYQQFPELAEMAHIATDIKALEENSYRYAIFINVSFHNLELASKLRRTGARLLYLYHEPWEAFYSNLHTDGLGIRLKAAAAHRLSLPLLKIADVVLLGSHYGLGVYRQGDARYNRNARCFPLIYDDEGGTITPEAVQKKHYFSYIGNIGRVHGFDQYVDVMREALLRKSDMKFLIASRSPLPEYVLRDEIVNGNLDKIELICGRTLQNKEINICYAKSFCVWNLYRRSMQSGVLPKAFMFGTPVIASRIGSFPEYVSDGFNGRFASADDRDGVLSALEEVRRRTTEYAGNCRRSFLNTFFYRSRLAELRKLLV